LQPDAAVAWNYSVWYRHSEGWLYPRVEHLYSLKRSLKIYSHMQELGIPAIPHIYWGLPQDLDRWATWLGQNPLVTTIAVDLQTVDGPEAWQSAVRGLQHLRTLLPRPIHLFVSGVCRVERVAQLLHVWPEMTLSNMGAYFASDFVLFKPRFGLAYRWRTDINEWPRTAIFNEAVRQYTSVESSQFDRYRVGTFNASSASRASLSSVTAPAGHIIPVQLSLWEYAESTA